MANLIDNLRNFCEPIFNRLLSPSSVDAGGSDMPGSSQQEPQSSQSNSRYSIFKSKNNQPSASQNRGIPHRLPSNIQCRTPRLSDPAQDRVCDHCKQKSLSLKCFHCSKLTHTQPSSISRNSYKPITKRLPATTSQLSGGAAEIELSDDEDGDLEQPIPAAAVTTNGSAAVVAVKQNEQPELQLTHNGMDVYLGSMSAIADVTVSPAEISLRNMSLHHPARKQKYNICIPAEDCHLSYYTGQGSSHLDKAIFFFIKMTVKAARDLMTALTIPITDYAMYRLDPKDPEEKYGFIAFKLPLQQSLQTIMSLYPENRRTVLLCTRAIPLFRSIKEMSDQRPKVTMQLQEIRSVHKDKFDRVCGTGMRNKSPKPSTSTAAAFRTPPNSAPKFYSKSMRKTTPKPEIIDLDEDDSGFSVQNGNTSPRPKRNRYAHMFVCDLSFNLILSFQDFE
jgi:hypothetical protein